MGAYYLLKIYGCGIKKIKENVLFLKQENTSLSHSSYQRTREKVHCLIRGLHYLQEYFQNVWSILKWIYNLIGFPLSYTRCQIILVHSSLCRTWLIYFPPFSSQQIVQLIVQHPQNDKAVKSQTSEHVVMCQMKLYKD